MSEGAAALSPSARADAELVRSAVEGQAAARHTLVLRLSPIVQRRVCRPLASSCAARGRSVERSEVLDLTQQILLLLFDRDSRVLRSWDPERGLSLANFVGLVAEREAKAILRSGRRSAWAEKPTTDDALSRPSHWTATDRKPRSSHARSCTRSGSSWRSNSAHVAWSYFRPS